MLPQNDFDSTIQTIAREPSRNSAMALEQLYREAIKKGQQDLFCAALARSLSSAEPSTLLDAWGFRLNILPFPESVPTVQTDRSDASRLWRIAILMSAILGLIWSLFSGGKPPVPFPGVAEKLFWLAWAPVTALLILAFVVIVRQAHEERRTWGIVSLIIAVFALLFGWVVWNEKDAVLLLTAFHLPFLIWTAVGAAATFRVQNPAIQRMSFIFKSAEALVAAGIYLAGAGIFGGLTLGIFGVLGIRFPEALINRCAALALGALPILAIATVYDPKRTPAEQDFSTGPARLMRVLTRLLLAPVLGVLAVYVLWFIPAYFWRAFEVRSVLLVYNASLAAVLLLIVLAIPHLHEEMSALSSKLLRQAIGAICAFALILNAYALSAVIYRTLQFGISPNRHAIIGWNVVTLFMLGSIVISLIRSNASSWTDCLRKSFSRCLPLAALWALWVLVVSPWIQ